MSEKQNAETLELLPCPFCGGNAELDRMGNPRQSCIVACIDCGCRLETGLEERNSGRQWNTRTAVPSPHPRGEPVAWRFRFEDVKRWTLLHQRPDYADDKDIICEPLYAAPPPAGADAVRDLTDKAAAWDAVSSARQSERRKTIEKVVNILRRRAAGYDGHRATAIFNGRIIADELRGNAREMEALADARPAPQPQEKPTGDQT